MLTVIHPLRSTNHMLKLSPVLTASMCSLWLADAETVSWKLEPISRTKETAVKCGAAG